MSAPPVGRAARPGRAGRRRDRRRAGIGQGIARRLGEAGASVVLHVRRDRSAAEVLAAELGERALDVAGDLLEDGVADAVAAPRSSGTAASTSGSTTPACSRSPR